MEGEECFYPSPYFNFYRYMIDEKKSPLRESSTPQWLSLKRTRYYQEHAGISCIVSRVYISVGITYFSQSKNLMMPNTRIFFLWPWITVNILKIARSLNSFGCSALSLTAWDKSCLCYFLGLHSSKFNWPYLSCLLTCERKVVFPKEGLQQKVIVKMEWENSWKMYRLIFNSVS